MREAGVKEKGALKTARLSFFPQEKLKKPDWIRVRAPAPDSRFHDIKPIARRITPASNRRGSCWYAHSQSCF